MIAPAKKIISSVKELRKIPQEYAAPKGVKQILVCAGGGCLASGSDKVITALRDEVLKQKLAGKVNVTAVGCMGLCVEGPVMLMVDDMTFYQRV
ncbi:MAG: (2Fe-2S) ferredoxin domain-containing protein, partial [Kiritimatiellales bacterium]